MLVSGCDFFGKASVKGIISRGPAMAVLENPEDIEAVAAVLPAKNSYINRFTSVNLVISGKCISNSVSVRATIAQANLTLVLNCDPSDRSFQGSVDLSGVIDGPIEINLEYLSEQNGTVFENPFTIHKLTKEIVFSIPEISVSNNSIGIPAVDEAASYRWQIRSQDSPGIYAIDTTQSGAEGSILDVSVLNPGSAYDIFLTVNDLAGNSFSASNSGSVSFVMPVTATITGAPSGISKLTTLDVTVGGAEVVSYRYKLGALSSTNCGQSAGYTSSDIPAGTKITDSIAGIADGDIRLCVVGKDAAGNLRQYAEATSVSWVKDTTPPTASLSGQPTGSSNTTLLNVTVGGTGVVSYKFKVGVSGSTDCT
ncbi:MAG: hypothetical protein RIQ81_67, partial [Pseudomonadota bacterium]